MKKNNKQLCWREEGKERQADTYCKSEVDEFMEIYDDYYWLSEKVLIYATSEEIQWIRQICCNIKERMEK